MIAPLLVVHALACAASSPFADAPSLADWVNVNGLPSTWTVEGDELVCSGVPAGMLRTRKPYGNFTLDLDWKHEKPDGNAGIFVWADAIPARGVPFPRSIEVQVMLTDDVKDKEGRLLYTGQGDLFSIHGATCTPATPHPAGWSRALPTERWTKGAGEWNHYTIVGKDGTLTLSVNGHEVSKVRDCSPRRGFICLESEGSPIRYRNIRITGDPFVPASDATGDPVRPLLMDGWVALVGADLCCPFKLDEVNEKHWVMNGTTLHYDGKGTDIWSKQSFGDFDLVADWRWTNEHQGKMQRPVINPDGSEAKNADGSPKTVEVEERDSGIFLRGNTKSQVNMWMWPVGSGEVYGYRTDSKMPPDVRAGVTPKKNADAKVGDWNRFEISMRGESLIVRLNGELVIDGAQLKGVPEKGPIGLQSHGCPVEFMNIYIRPVETSAK